MLTIKSSQCLYIGNPIAEVIPKANSLGQDGDQSTEGFEGRFLGKKNGLTQPLDDFPERKFPSQVINMTRLIKKGFEREMYIILILSRRFMPVNC